MEMVEGASLQDHFNALLERKGQLSEERIWHIFVQVGAAPCLLATPSVFRQYVSL
jgi:hypothetical protein